MNTFNYNPTKNNIFKLLSLLAKVKTARLHTTINQKSHPAYPPILTWTFCENNVEANQLFTTAFKKHTWNEKWHLIIKQNKGLLCPQRVIDYKNKHNIKNTLEAGQTVCQEDPTFENVANYDFIKFLDCLANEINKHKQKN